MEDSLSVPEVAFSELVDHFGLDQVEWTSLGQLSSVFRCRIAGQDAVVKSTPWGLTIADAVAQWTRYLQKDGLSIIAPLSMGVDNPVQLDQTTWVAYPWVHGRPYRGSTSDIAEAGKALGQMHALSVEVPELRQFNWPASRSLSPVEPDMLANLPEGVVANLDPRIPRIINYLADLFRSLDAVITPALRTANLPNTTTTTDFKVNNLIYHDDGLTIVDTDNGAFSPRLLDLAQTLVFFQQGCSSVKNQLLSPAQWLVFRDSYLSQVQLTQSEIALWSSALDYTLCLWGAIALLNTSVWAPSQQNCTLAESLMDLHIRYPLN